MPVAARAAVRDAASRSPARLLRVLVDEDDAGLRGRRCATALERRRASRSTHMRPAATDLEMAFATLIPAPASRDARRRATSWRWPSEPHPRHRPQGVHPHHARPAAARRRSSSCRCSSCSCTRYALSFDVKHLPDRRARPRPHRAEPRSTSTRCSSPTTSRSTSVLDSYAEVDQALRVQRRTRSSSSSAPASATTSPPDAPGSVQILVDGSDPNSAQLGADVRGGAVARLRRARSPSRRSRRRASTSPRARRARRRNTRTWYNPEGTLGGLLRPGADRRARHDGDGPADREHARAGEGAGHLRAARSSRRSARIELMVGKIAPWALHRRARRSSSSRSSASSCSRSRSAARVAALRAREPAVRASARSGSGCIISARASSVDAANQLGGARQLPARRSCSPASSSRSRSMPSVLQCVSYLFPARYFMVITRTVFLKGGGLDVLWPQIAALAVFAVVDHRARGAPVPREGVTRDVVATASGC